MALLADQTSEKHDTIRVYDKQLLIGADAFIFLT